MTISEYKIFIEKIEEMKLQLNDRNCDHYLNSLIKYFHHQIWKIKNK